MLLLTAENYGSYYLHITKVKKIQKIGKAADFSDKNIIFAHV